MCIPAAVAAGISLAMTAIGTGISIIGQRQQNKAIEARARFESQVARNKAIQAGRLADDALKRGEIAKKQNQLKTRRKEGEARVVLAANGVVVDEGSAQDLVEDIAEIGELENEIIINNAEREVLAFRTQQSNFRNEGLLAEARGQTSNLALIGTALSGASQVAGNFASFKQAGVFK